RVACNNKGNAVLQPRHTAQDSSGSDSAVATTSVEPPGASAYPPRPDEVAAAARTVGLGQERSCASANSEASHLHRRGIGIVADPRWHRRRQAASLDT